MSHFTSVDEYIRSFPEEEQKIIQTLRDTIRKELPDAEEVISYNIPAFKQNGGYIIYYSGWKKHTAVYPFSAEMGDMLKESSEYKTSGKGTIQFPLDQPLPLPLIRKIVRHLAQENSQRKSKDK